MLHPRSDWQRLTCRWQPPGMLALAEYLNKQEQNADSHFLQQI